jgi:hypothetical protein
MYIYIYIYIYIHTYVHIHIQGFNVTVHEYPTTSHSLQHGQQGTAIHHFMLSLVQKGCTSEKKQEV